MGSNLLLSMYRHNRFVTLHTTGNLARVHATSCVYSPNNGVNRHMLLELAKTRETDLCCNLVCS
jgi:hypothetical protein